MIWAFLFDVTALEIAAAAVVAVVVVAAEKASEMVEDLLIHNQVHSANINNRENVVMAMHLIKAHLALTKTMC